MEKNEKLKILKDLISINSVNGNEIAVSLYLAEIFKKYGFAVEIDEFKKNRSNLIFEFGKGISNKVLCLTGHQDTVEVSSGWETNPFKAKVADNKIYGRGSADMKSGLAAEVIAIIELLEKNYQPKGKVRLIATAGEEFGAIGAKKLVKKGIADDITAMIVGEPTDNHVVYAHSGTINYKIKSYGKAYHSSQPQKGINAILGLTEYIKKESCLFKKAPLDNVLGEVKHSITKIDGGTQINIIPKYAELLGNIRPTVKFNNTEVLNKIKDAIEIINKTTEYNLQFELLHNFYPVYTNPEDDFVKLALNVSSYFTQRKIALKTINGATDASVFIHRNPKIKTVILGTHRWENAHQVDEFTTVDSYLNLIETYKQIIIKYFR